MTETLVITGDTYSSRHELKALAGRWVPHLKAWLVPTAYRHAVKRLQAEIGFDVAIATSRTDKLTQFSRADFKPVHPDSQSPSPISP